MATIAADLEGVIDGYMTAYVTDTSSTFINAIGPFFLALVTIYFLITGYFMLAGKIQQPVNDMLTKFLKIAIISGFALSVGTYQSIVTGFFYGIPEGLISTLGMGSSIGDMIDSGAQPFNDIYTAVSKKTSLNPGTLLNLALTGFLFWIVQGFFFICALAFFMLTKIAMGLLLAIGPIFIMLAIFPVTQKYFENWVNQLLQVAFLQVLLGMLYTLLISIAMQYAQRVVDNLSLANWIGELYALDFLLVVFLIFIFNVNKMASALTGGFGVEGLSSAVTRYLMYRGFGGKPTGNLNKPNDNKISNEKSKSTDQPPIYNRRGR